MTTPQTPVDALAAQARVFAYDIQAHHISDALADKVSELLNQCADQLEASARALAVIPAESDALGYATQLAQSIFNKHFAHEPHYSSGDVVWRPLDDLLGVLTQIDNMVAGIVQQAGGVPAGFVLVPVEPTDEMELAAENDYEQRGETFPDWKAKWRAMIAASPSPSAVQPLSEAQPEWAACGSQVDEIEKLHSFPVDETGNLHGHTENLNVHLLWRDACKEWGEVCGGPDEYEIFANKLIAALRASSPAETKGGV